jgi:hypothetical protein
MANEKRLIDADVIYNAVENRYRVSSGIEHRCERDLLDLICSAPTVDAVEVVRCKDCKHLEITGCYGECNKGYMGIVKPWDFCSYGERKDNA